MKWRSSNSLILCLGLAVMAGCASVPPDGSARSDKRAKQVQPRSAADVKAPRRVQERYERALVLMQVEDFEGAERAFTVFIESHPDYAGPYVNLGIIYSRTERLEQAESALDEAIARNPSNSVAQNELGIVYRKLGRFEDAARAYNRAVEAAPGFAAPHLNLGVLYDLYLQRPDVALEHYVNYQKLNGGNDERVAKWIAELKMRIGSEQRSARVTQ